MIDYFLKRTFVVNFISIVIVVFGIAALTTMKRDLHPPWDFKNITVSTQLEGATASEMESLVTFPLEDALKGLPGVEKMTSNSSQGRANITLRYSAGYDDMLEAVEMVRSRVNSLVSRLPKDLKPIQVSQDKTTDIYQSSYVLKNFNERDPVHRQAFNNIRREIEKTPGVARIDGQPRARNIFVRWNSQKLAELGMSPSDLRRVITESMGFIPLGEIRENETEIAVELKRADVDITTLAEVPLDVNRMGNLLKLKDVAEVTFDLSEAQTRALFEGKRVLEFEVFKNIEADSIRLQELLDKKVERLKKELPEPLELVLSFDGKFFIEQQISVLINNGVGGLILVTALLMIFLTPRAALMTAVGIPLSYFGTFIALSAMGIDIDLVSIIGMILVVGILIDDAIIVSERYVSLLAEGAEPYQAARMAAKELILPVTGTILTTIVAFSPILFLKSEMTILLAAIPLVIIFSLTISWFESFFILPNHLAHFVKKVEFDRTHNLFESAKRKYQAIVLLTLKWRYVVALATTMLIIGVGYLGAKKLQHNFSFGVGLEQIRIYAYLKNSSSLEETDQALKPIHEMLEQYSDKEVEFFTTRIGRVWRDGRELIGYRFATITVTQNKFTSDPKKALGRLLKDIEKKLEPLKTEQFEVLSIEDRKRGSERKKEDTVTVRIESSDEKYFSEIEAELVRRFNNQGMVGELKPQDRRFQDGWVFTPVPSQLKKYEFSPESLGEQIRQYITPLTIYETRYMGETVSIVSEAKTTSKLQFKAIESLGVLTNRGLQVPLKYLGSWSEVKTLKRIEHRNGERVVELDFAYDKEKNSNQEVKVEMESKIQDLIKKYPQYRLVVQELSDEEKESRDWSYKVAIYCIGLILTVLVFTLGGIGQTILVGMAIPFGIVGVIAALYLHGLPLGLMAMIGIVGCAGVAVNDSIVMVDQINRLAREGALTAMQIAQGAASRLRAIFLTTVTTLAGVLPTAYSIGGESGFTKPLAFAMGWGLLLSTTLTLLVLPSLLLINEDIKSFCAKAWRRFQAPHAKP